jgi:hypothetical protein
MAVDPATMTTDELVDYIHQQYPAYAGFLAIPEIKNILVWSAVAHFSAGQLTAAIQSSDWYRRTQSTARDWLALTITDPETAGAKRTARAYELNNQLRIMGGTPNMSLPQLADLADQSLMFGWDETTTKVQLATWAQYHPVAGSDPALGLNVQAGSQVGANMNAVKATAHQYLVNVDPHTAASMAWQMYRGELDQPGVIAHFTQLARTEHPDMAHDIDNGLTPLQVMAPVTQTVAQLLERAPDTIDYLNPQYSELLQHRDANGQIRRMTQSEAGVWARGQAGWDQTENGRNTIAQTTQSLLQGFGKVR